MNERLRFKEPAREAFRFLVEHYGFQCAEECDDHLRYEGHGVFVDVHFDSERSYEMDVCVGLTAVRPNAMSQSFNLADVMALSGGDTPHAFQATTQERISRLVVLMAELLRSHGNAVLQGDRDAFAKLARQLEVKSRRALQDLALQDARARAEKAWRAGDFRAVVACLESVRQLLTPSERRKLEIARSRS